MRKTRIRESKIIRLPKVSFEIRVSGEEAAVRGACQSGRSFEVTEYSPEPSGRALSLDKKISRVLHGLTNRSLVSAKPKSDELEISGEALGNAIWAWQQRACYLPGELFSDPAWGMLLEILQAEVDQRRATISRLCKASGVSTTSAVRWLKALEDHDLVIRRVDQSDSAEFAELTPKASGALRRYFRNVVQRR